MEPGEDLEASMCVQNSAERSLVRENALVRMSYDSGNTICLSIMRSPSLRSNIMELPVKSKASRVYTKLLSPIVEEFIPCRALAVNRRREVDQHNPQCRSQDEQPTSNSLKCSNSPRSLQSFTVLDPRSISATYRPLTGLVGLEAFQGHLDSGLKLEPLHQILSDAVWHWRQCEATSYYNKRFFQSDTN
ncbi:hypothetical protein BDY19DRAFT_310365 [Irpex rosettiformis]|uniref:Uncharacterized protein n=1 Tax=Irpex rosettiformis TaxID=378272 RepID=A0ACB8TZ40_9APHY|nr:hypothetical protein BDY19DRAFT_310365 [Irpex rosettiformis]